MEKALSKFQKFLLAKVLWIGVFVCRMCIDSFMWKRSSIIALSLDN